MSMQSSAPRPATKSIGAAFADILLTLGILVVTFLAFLIAPLLVLAVAYLAYVVLRPRSRKRSAAAQGAGGGQAGSPPVSAHSFGAGAAS